MCFKEWVAQHSLSRQWGWDWFKIKMDLTQHCQRRQWQPTPVLLPGKSHGWRSLVGCRPWGGEESDTTEWLHFHFSLSCIGEGNGNPLQCSCLENPRDRGAWWAAVYGVAQSWTRLKRLSSSRTFLLVFLEFSIYSMSSAKWQFCFFFSLWIPFRSFSSLLAMTRSSKTILNKSGESGIPYLVPDHRGNALSLSLLSMILAICLSYLAFTMLRYVSSMPISWNSFFFF